MTARRLTRPRGAVRSVAAVTAALTLLPVAALVGPASAPAYAATGRCTRGTGVTVVVDYGPLGGGTRIGCDPNGAGRAGSQVVPAAGFPLTYVPGQPFVCRVSGKPTTAQENCADVPPASAYWGLFWSDGSPATWTYSSIGITGLKVPKGGSIAWRWQNGGTRDLPGAAPNLPATTSVAAPDGASPSPSSPGSTSPTRPPASQTTRPATPAPPTNQATPTRAPSSAATSPPDTPSAEPTPTRSQPSTGSRSNAPGGRDGQAGRDRDRRRPAAAGAGSAPSPAQGQGSDRTSDQALAPLSSSTDGGGGDGQALLWVAGGLIAALAAGALLVARRRSGPGQ